MTFETSDTDDVDVPTRIKHAWMQIGLPEPEIEREIGHGWGVKTECNGVTHRAKITDREVIRFDDPFQIHAESAFKLIDKTLNHN